MSSARNSIRDFNSLVSFQSLYINTKKKIKKQGKRKIKAKLYFIV